MTFATNAIPVDDMGVASSGTEQISRARALPSFTPTSSSSTDFARSPWQIHCHPDSICALLFPSDERNESDVRRYCPRDASRGSIQRLLLKFG